MPSISELDRQDPAEEPEAARLIRRRARSHDAKLEVRNSIIAMGRRAFATQSFDKVSLRGIAAASGYAPSVIYRYFADRQALFLAIREVDLDEALTAQERFASRIVDPGERLRRLFLYAVKYWETHAEHYEVLYARPRSRSEMFYQDGSCFGQGALVRRSVTLWETGLRDLFDTWPRYPTSLRLATDTMLIALHGVIAVPARMSAREWSSSARLANETIDVMLRGWQVASTEDRPDRP